MMRTRFAPTPSGYLHLGNAAHALLCSWLAEEIGATLVLRIDDIDRDRCRPAYENDILGLVDWLGMRPTVVVRQSERMDAYARARDGLLGRVDVFACSCSRRDAAEGRACECADARRELEPGRTSLKWRSGAGDIVLWRREGIPAYHLASVLDDEELGCTHILRGEDLREATEVQRGLAGLLGATTFSAAEVRFHGLLTDDAGAKLSKSQRDDGPLTRSDATRQAVWSAARALAAGAGITAH